VWSESSSLGSKASLYLSDSELKAIRDLGVVGRSRAVTGWSHQCDEGLGGGCVYEQLFHGGSGAF